ncbi:MAG: patatin-like phospholipase family protein, partial [Hyphomicrobiaceae bacterium]
ARPPRTTKEHIESRNFDSTALVLQGGGALGAYQAGVYEALMEAGCEPDWVAGISIGAINSAIIAGNSPADRLPKLRQFWERVTSAFPYPAPDMGNVARRLFNQFSALASMTVGQPGFFGPRPFPSYFLPHGAKGASSFYDTAPLRDTLNELIDFDRLNSGVTRLSVGTVDIRSGNFRYFDTTETRIRAEHIMASGALPPGLPPIEIDGEYYWDGGLVSNTPLQQVLETDRGKETLVFQVDLFSARGEVPGDLLEAEERRKHIVFSSRTRLSTDQFREKKILKEAISELFDRLPPEIKQEEEVRKLRSLADDHSVAIVHLIYRRRPYEGQVIDFEFSRASMEEHWKAGLDDARRTLADPQWLKDWAGTERVRVFDINRKAY